MVRRTAKVALPLLILAAAVGSFLLLKASKPQAVPIEVKEQAWVVGVEPARPESVAPELVLYGAVESPRVARLTSALQADVLAVDVLEGQEVERGQLLARLDDRDVRFLVAQREAELAQIEADIASENARHEYDLQALPHERTLLELSRNAVERAQDLARKQVGSQSNVDEALQGVERQALNLNRRELAVREYTAKMARLEAARVRAEALLDQANLDLERTRIRAPFTGRIARVDVAPGDRVRPGDRMFEVYDLTALQVRAEVPSRYVAEVRSAIAAGFELAAEARVDGVPVRLQLRHIAGRVGGDSGGVEALFAIVRGGRHLPLGRFVSLELTLPPEPNVVAVPQEAIYGTNRLYLLDAGRMRGITVERVGELRTPEGDDVLVRSPRLSAGAPIIVTQLPNAIDGLRVEAAEAPGGIESIAEAQRAEAGE
jgi:RND family efflux transporter MFP subunit